MAASILAQRYAVRRQGLSTGKTTLGRAVFHTVASRIDRSFSIHQLRMREIEALIVSRHGMIVPDPAGTDDVDTCLAYAGAVAASLSHQDLHQWARRWMPWAAAADLDRIANAVGWRKYMIGANQAADLLFVTMEERTRLELKTIGACDVTAAERQEIAKATKRHRDRERIGEKRRADSVVDRRTYEAESLSATKPWEQLGMSRATWYRRRETGVSQVEIKNTIGDTPVSPIGDTPATPAARQARRHDSSTTPPVTSQHGSARGDGIGPNAATIASPPSPALRFGASVAGPGPHRSGDGQKEDAA